VWTIFIHSGILEKRVAQANTTLKLNHRKPWSRFFAPGRKDPAGLPAAKLTENPLWDFHFERKRYLQNRRFDLTGVSAQRCGLRSIKKGERIIT